MKNFYMEKRENIHSEVNYQRKGSYGYRRIQGSSSFSSKVRSQLERIEMLYSLKEIREILIQERNRDYYRDPMNVLEEVTLENGTYVTEVGVEYDAIQKMMVYQNGMCDFWTEKKLKKEKNG